MKIAVIWSSANSDGLTAEAKNSIISGIDSEKNEIDEILLNGLKLQLCRACNDGWGRCRSEGQCALSDDFQNVYDRLVSADGIVLVSAVYWSEMTEQMKLFLDRLRRCEAAHNHFLSGKRCILTACAGGTGNGALECLHQMENTIKHMGMRAYDRLSVIRYNKDYMIPALKAAGAVYAERLKTGFDMYF